MRASGAPPGCAKERLGSKPPSCSVPGPQPAKRPAIPRRSFTGCAPAAAPKKRSARSPPRSSPSSYHMLVSGELYRDLGPDHFDRRAKATQTKRLVTRLQNLGYAVQIAPLPA